MAASILSSNFIEEIMYNTNKRKDSRLRLKNWKRVIKWEIEAAEYFWKTENDRFTISDIEAPDIVLKCTEKTLEALALQQLPFYLAVRTGDIQFEGSVSDQLRLGYIFLNKKNDKRKRKIVFIAHCFLNINTRFPEGSAFEGANIPLIELLLQDGIGIVQMPCPEFLCLGLEKDKFGEVDESILRKCFRRLAEEVVDQIEQYLDFGYEIVGIIGMNPSPSCGVEISLGKGRMLGRDKDSSEKKGSGVFVEELRDVARVRGLEMPSIFGVRRILTGEGGMEERLNKLRERIRFIS